MADKRIINVVFQDDCIHLLLTEHVDVLALLDLIRYIVNGGLQSFLLLTVSLFFRLLFGLFFHLVSITVGRLLCFQILVHGRIFTIQILEQYILHHTLTEFFVLDAAKFDKRTDIVPVFLIILTVCLTHTA